MEAQRLVLNMQISLLHTLARQARECASKLAWAEAVSLRRGAEPGGEAARPDSRTCGESSP
jgi:hypothetical protein